MALTLINRDGDAVLVVARCREDTADMVGNLCVFGDNRDAYAPRSFDAERERQDIEQQHHVVLNAVQSHGLNCGANADRFVGIDGGIGRTSEPFGHTAANQWHAGHATNHDDIVDIGDADVGRIECLLADVECALDQWCAQRLQLAARECFIEIP